MPVYLEIKRKLTLINHCLYEREAQLGLNRQDYIALNLPGTIGYAHIKNVTINIFYDQNNKVLQIPGRPEMRKREIGSKNINLCHYIS